MLYIGLMRKHKRSINAVIVLAIIASSALLVCCSADFLMNTGKNLISLGNTAMIARNSQAVDDAVEMVNSFIEESESAFDWPEDGLKHEPQDRKPTFKSGDEGKPYYFSAVKETVDAILAARDSSAKDKELREALNAKYEGKASDLTPYTSLYAGLQKTNLVGYLISALEDPNNRDNIVMLLYVMGVRGISTETIKDGIDKIKDISIPFPLTSMDYWLVVGTILEEHNTDNIGALKDLANAESGGETEKADLSILKQFQKDIVNSVAERKYQTVGDKIVVGAICELVSSVVELNYNYRQTPQYTEADEQHKYTEFMNYLLSEGKPVVEKAVNYLDAISYIYDVRLDLAGLAAAMV